MALGYEKDGIILFLCVLNVDPAGPTSKSFVEWLGRNSGDGPNKHKVRLSRRVFKCLLKRNVANKMDKKRFLYETKIRRSGLQITAWRALPKQKSKKETRWLLSILRSLSKI